MDVTAESVFATVQTVLPGRSEIDGSIALMTCGLPGTGKTTLSKNVLSRMPNYERLSLDEIVAEKHGLYGKDYAASLSLYEQYQDEADQEFRKRLLSCLEQKKNIILDRAFYAREDREEFTKIVTDNGGTCVLVYLKVSAAGKEALWQRIVARSAKERDANSAYDISRDIFERYWAGFEGPDGEEELVVDVL